MASWSWVGKLWYKSFHLSVCLNFNHRLYKTTLIIIHSPYNFSSKILSLSANFFNHKEWPNGFKVFKMGLKYTLKIPN